MSDILREWYYLGYNWRGTSVLQGPFTTSEMNDLLRKGEINDRTQVRYKNRGPWKPLRDLPTFSRVVDNKESGYKRPGSFTGAGALLLCIVVLVLLGGTYHWRTHKSFQSRESHSVSSPSPFHENLTGQAITDITNRTRAENGLPPLKENSLLNTIAESRARDMIKKQYFAHISPTGEQASDLARSVGYPYKRVAENIASGTFLSNQKVVDGWMQSPGHRKNILSTDVDEIGASVIKGTMDGHETYVAVQIFGLQSPPVTEHTCVAPSQELSKKIDMRNAEIASLSERLERLASDLRTERASIDSDRTSSGRDAQERISLNTRINAYNEKTEWYNAMVAEKNGKVAATQAMVRDYNRMLENYRECAGSKQ